MNCPSCDFQSPYEAVCCPHCRAVFDTDALETLGHLRYLRDRLERWRAEGLLAPDAAEAAIASADRDLAALAARLTPAPWAAPVPAVGAAPIAPPSPPMPAAVTPSVTPLADEAGAAVPLGEADVLPVHSPMEADEQPAAAMSGSASGPVHVSAEAEPPAEPVPAGPSFEWRNIGTYLLSERTLHGLLGLGAFMILAAGAVISTLNPTGLPPLPHLGAVVATTLLFFAAGAFVRQRLRLLIAGATLLGIAGAFVPLTIWTLGQRQLLDWETGAIWLAASLVSLPLYLAAHRLLRDRTFAVLAAMAGGSELLASLNWLGVPLEWGLAALMLLAIGYVRLASRLGGADADRTSGLPWALTWTAEFATPVLLLALLFGRLGSDAWLAMVGRPLSAWGEYAIGAGWWLGVLFYVQGTRLLGRRRHLYAAAWTLPVAFLLTLTRAPWEASWYNVCLAALAGAYLVVAWRRIYLTPQPSEEAPPPNPLPIAMERGSNIPVSPSPAHRERGLGGEGLLWLALDPFIQVMLVLALAAAFWPAQTAPSRIATLYLLAGLFTAATALLRVRAPAWLGMALLGVAHGLSVSYFEVVTDARALAWAGLGAVLLAAGEVAVRRTGEGDRSLLATVFAGPSWGRTWESRLGAPLFAAGYLVSLLALGIALGAYAQVLPAAGVRRLTAPALWGFAAVLGALAASSVARRTSFFLYPVVWLALIPLTATAADLFDWLAWPLREPELARILAGISFLYLVMAWSVDRAGGRYPRPLYLAGYLLLPGAMLLSSVDRTATVQVVGFGVLVYTLSAWLTHRDQLLSFDRLVERICGSTTSDAGHSLRGFWLYLAAWLLPIWAILLTRLWQPGIIWYALVLSGLSLAYPAVGLWIRRVRSEYRWPWYLGGYALSAIGPLVALTDTTYRPVVLGLSIALYVVSTVVGRQSAWLYPVTILLPALLWETMTALGWAERGLGLVSLALAYEVVGLGLHRRATGKGWLPIRGRIGAYGVPFLVVGYALAALGLARAANQSHEIAAIAFAIGTVQFALSAFVFRQPLFGWVTVGLFATAYVFGLTLTPLDPTHRGLGLLPGGLLMLLISEGLRRIHLTPPTPLSGAERGENDQLLPLSAPERGENDQLLPLSAPERGPGGEVTSRVTAWSLPWLVVACLAAVAAPTFSTWDQWSWTFAWTGSALLFAVGTLLLRHPLGLYPTLVAGTVAFLAAGYLVQPTLAPARSYATLAGLTWLFLGAAWLLDRGRRAPDGLGGQLWAMALSAMDPDGPKRLDVREAILDARAALLHWSLPLHVMGWATAVLACLGSAPEAQAGLWAAGAVAVLVVVLTALNGAPAYAWLGLAATLLAYEHALRVARIDWAEQPPYWAGAALVAALLSLLPRVWPSRSAASWSRPLRWSSVVLAVEAAVAALLLVTAQPARQGFEDAALAVALAGLTSMVHAFVRRDRRLVYLGVALLEAGFMLELLVFEVGQAQAFTLPAGLFVLAVAYFEWRRGTTWPVKRTLEIGGLVVLLGVSLIQAVGFLGDGHDRYVYDTFLLLESAGLLALGAVLRWRYTFFLATVALVADVVILLKDPLGALNTWYLVALIGLALIGGVIWIERQRQRIPLWVESWRARLEQWD